MVPARRTGSSNIRAIKTATTAVVLAANNEARQPSAKNFEKKKILVITSYFVQYKNEENLRMLAKKRLLLLSLTQ